MQKYQQIQIIGRCPQDNSVLMLICNKQNAKYFMAKKIILFSQTQSKEQQILKEAKILKELSHPHVLKYEDIFLDNDTLFEVLQFCQYGDILHYLQKKKQRNQTLSQKTLLSWIMQILMALQYLHEKKIIHRLISPQNIYLNHQGDLKIGSFGSAKQMQNTMQKAHTIIGQPCFMSPQMVEGSTYDTKLDIWSLGCLVYQLATFQPPFKFGNLLKLYDSIVKQPCPELPVKYSKYLSPLYKKMMKKNPNSRPSATQLLQQPVFAALMKEYLKRKKIDSLDLKNLTPKPLAIQKKRINEPKKKILLQPIMSSRLSDQSPMKKKNEVQNQQNFNKTMKFKSPSKQIQENKIKKDKCAIVMSEKSNCKKEQLIPVTNKDFSQQIVKQINCNQTQAKKQIKQAQTQYISLLYQVKLKKIEQKYEPNMSKIFQKTQQFQSFKDLLKY